MWFPVLFRFLAHSLTTFGRWGCGERINLSHVVGNFIVVLLEMSRLVAPETRSQTLRRTKRVLNARQGMEGAKNAYRGSQEVRRAEAPRQRVAVVTGTTGQRPAPPAKPNRTGLVATGWWVVVDRRCYSDGVWGSSQTVSGCASRRCRNRAVGGVKGGVAALQGPLCEIERSEM